MKQSISQMMSNSRPLYSDFGLTMLRLQETMREMIRSPQGDAIAPNYYRIDLIDDSEGDAEQREALRGALSEELQQFAEANEWSFRSRPIVVIRYVAYADEAERCVVSARHVDCFGRLEIADDRGVHEVKLAEPLGIIGRAHTGPPRSFVPVADASSMLSREHLRLIFDEKGWSAELIGRNRTTLDGEEMEPGLLYRLEQGGTIACEPYTIRLLSGIDDEE